ncbi:MAG: thiamine/thiamine pyrophosphate ABC transporter permease [Gammaproteobacteria bacterium]|nr:thiamine/thiamine pyrophosphate ABC transporter permease [Gammaproteobacteria bacterium]
MMFDYVRHHAWLGFSLIALGLIVGPFVVVVFALSGQFAAIDWSLLATDAYLRAVIWFSIWQAALSTVLSVGLALPLARALARRQFVGRGLLLRVFSVALVIPPIVAVYGLVVVHGRQGWVNELLRYLDLSSGSYLYGLVGILLAHVFFNLPLATRIVLQRMESIEPESWRLASQLGMSSWQHWRLLEWPHIRSVLAPLAALIFALCFTSFAIIMSLGGGPRATTLEVAIYQAVRLDFDLPLATQLSLVQLVLCSFIVWLGLRLGRPAEISHSIGVHVVRPDIGSWQSKLADVLLLLLGLVLIVLPLSGVILAGLNGHWGQVLGDAQLWLAAWNSLWVAVCAAALCLFMAWGLLLMRRHTQERWPWVAAVLESVGMLTLVMPALVLGTGLFLALRLWVDVFAINLYLVLLVNSILGLPFMLRVLTAPYLQLARQHDRLCTSLDISGWHRLRQIEWPLLKPAIGLGLAIVAAFCVGDLGVVALFGTPDIKTLPLLMYQRLGSYQADAAAVTAVVLLALCLLVFVMMEKGVGGRRA